ncbi:MAG: hypothetical protein A2289_23980 [Deltaproteobacteria bacterium RIFOXYA12_FULL_58_15]|nr:MAG: hypothetical protein A2289_23980 [Deltaproteobacteria bacterium RIFOXYA12_FULL_58_15]
MACRILLADSDIPSLQLMTTVLTRHGFVVEATNDGGDALARFFETTPEVVVCDTELSGLSGCQLCRQIREHSTDVRLVMFRPNAAAVTELDGLRCDGVLERPFSYGALEELLVGWNLAVAGGSSDTATDPTDFSVPPPSAILGSDEELSFASLELGAGAPSPLGARGLAATLKVDVPTQPPQPMVPALVRSPDGERVRPAAITDTAPIPLPLPLPLPAADGLQAAVEIEVDDKRAVRAKPRRIPGSGGLPPSIPRFGSLAETPLPRLMFELYVGTYSGKLCLKRKGLSRTVYFWGGVPVRVDSDQLSESLGVLLREAGRITEAQYHKGQNHALEHQLRLGEALVEMGALQSSELLEALAAQTEEKIVNTFAWREGKFEFCDDTAFGEEDLLNEVSPLPVIWRGVHEHYELGALMTFFSRLRDRYIVTADLFAVQFEQFGAHLRELSVVSLLNGKTTFFDALSSDDSRAIEIAQALYVLMVTDMIRPSVTPGDPAPIVERKQASREAEPVDYRTLMEISERIAQELLRIKGKDHYEILKISRSASTDEIEAAYKDAIDTVKSDGRRPGLPHDAIKRTRDIGDLLTQARAALVDPDGRCAYDASLSLSAPSVGESGPTPQRREAFYEAEQSYKEGVRLLDLLDARGARVQFEAALKGNPAEPTYRVAMAQAVILLHQKDPAAGYREAFSFLKEALRIDPGNIAANIEVARLLASRGMGDRARIHLERVLRRAPHHQKARALVEEIEATKKQKE